ncbi:putative disease resistance protein RGA3 [Sesamum alatum]|uniref:Disease resistance protein RGA3 n=1 Tax=Sesamum alatum TaxID=300844 RepID=A0AAE2CM57_9LAMI|nr:putative disease resistance protein RGA3 [Sesamum alatum]
MADAIVSVALERLADVIQEKIREEVSLVRGVEKEIGYLSSKLNTIRNVLEDAERRRYKQKTIQNWLNKLEDVSHDIDDVLDKWNFAALKLRIEGSDDFVHLPRMKVCPFIPSSCLCFNKIATRRDIAQFDVSDIYGRRPDQDILVSKLRLEVAGQQLQLGPQVISIVGVGGIGKTTLAQLVYNDDRLVNFFELKIWVCVSDEVRVVKAILESAKKRSSDLNELEALLNDLKDSILGKKFLLVLDDVWTEDYTKWEPLKSSLNCGGPGSKILVTTRSQRVATIMGTTTNDIHLLGQLSNVDCWLLMKRVAFYGRENCEELQEIGKKIANKCKGLPLAAKVLGSLLRFKDSKEEWESILENEIWKLERAKVELFSSFAFELQ